MKLTTDRYHTQTPFLIHDYLSVNNTNGDLPTPDTFLFNDSNTAPDFTFEPGKRYLLRMVSMSALACGQFHIDGHTLQVVGIDGVQVKPQNADTIVVCASQRYDVIVTGKLGATTSFKWIAKMTTDMLTHDIPSDDALSIIGTVVYSLLGQIINIIASMLTPNWTPQAVLDDMTLTPLDNTPLFSPVTRNISFKVNQTYYDGIGTRIALGSQPWTEPKVPSLYTTFSTGDAAFNETTYGPGVDPWVLKHNDIVQIYMENPSPQPHPMHLHGKHPSF
jgi:iron transport multicopper oxidase